MLCVCVSFGSEGILFPHGRYHCVGGGERVMEERGVGGKRKS